MDLAFSNRSITLADQIPLECLLPRRRMGGKRPPYWIERLERRVHCSSTETHSFVLTASAGGTVMIPTDSTPTAVSELGIDVFTATLLDGTPTTLPPVLDPNVNGSWIVNGNVRVDTGDGSVNVQFPSDDPTHDKDIKDYSFGTNGVATIDGFDRDTAQSVVVQPDGKIVVAGWSGAKTTGFGGDTVPESITVVRLNSDGSLDTSFGTDGKANFPILTKFEEHGFGWPLPMVRLADGSLLIGGDGVRKLTPDGKLDASFTIGDRPAFGMALTADGKIVTMDQHFGFQRRNADGTLDTSFGDGGSVDMEEGMPKGNHDSYQIAIQPDGKIVSIGVFHRPDPVPPVDLKFALTRLNADGTPDTSFGDGGYVFTDSPDAAGYLDGRCLTLLPDGKILAAGNGEQGLAMARYNPDGSLDTTFGDHGVVFDTNSRGGYAHQIMTDANGKILVASDSWGGATVTRYNPDGTPDTTFGQGGRSTTRTQLAAEPDRIYEGAFGMTLQGDGKIVVTGQIELGNNHTQWSQDHADFFVLRLDEHANNSTPPAEGTDGSSEGSNSSDATVDLNRPQAAPVFSGDRIGLEFDLDDPTGKKKDLDAAPQDELASR
jgi:uncharacterized delta-60 repeat protein